MFLSSSIAYFIALTSPGPDTAIIIKQCSTHGRKSGVFTALGIGLGIFIHCILAVSGISLIICEKIRILNLKFVEPHLNYK